MRTAIIAGSRTPFVRSGTLFQERTAIELGKAAVRGVLARSDLDPGVVDELLFGTVLHDAQAPNIAREVGLGTLPRGVPASTVSRACASSNQAIADAAALIGRGYAHCIIAGGAEALSRIPITLSDPLSRTLVAASKARSVADRMRLFAALRLRDLAPIRPQIAEPSTGESMGEAAERMAKENGITREAQDRWALQSHLRAHAGFEDGRLTTEVTPFYLPPDFASVVERDNGIRGDTSMEALAKLRPAFDRVHGSVTAGNASPLTDGGAAVLLMSEEAVRAHGVRPLAWIRSWAFTAVDPAGQLLQAPAWAAPLALDRAGIPMREVGLMEMHEAFASQILSNLQALGSRTFAERELGRPEAVGHPDEDRINVMGGSIALGHPFGATGARITTTLAHEMVRRDVEFGLMTVCAAGGMGFAMVLERG